jgi:hypothetical protein
MIAKIIHMIFLLLWSIETVLIVPQLIVDNKITAILSKIGYIMIIVNNIIILFFIFGMFLYKLWC